MGYQRFSVLYSRDTLPTFLPGLGWAGLLLMLVVPAWSVDKVLIVSSSLPFLLLVASSEPI